MTVTVIVPLDNRSEYLDECISSILCQSHTDLDIILVDDGSTDGSGSLCDRYAGADARVRVIHKDSGGPSSARNAGLDIAAGKYVTFVDSDDIIHHDLVSTLLSMIGNNDIAISQFFRGCVCDWPKMTPTITTYTKTEAIEQTLYQNGITNSMCGKLFDINLFDGLRYTEGLWYEDLDLFYRLYERADNGIISTSRPLYFYRDNPTSFINTFDSKRLDVLKVTDDILCHYSEDALLYKAAVDRAFSANFNMFILTSEHRVTREAAGCWEKIKRHRNDEIANPKVRIKNKLGAILSYLGPKTVLYTAKFLKNS